MFFLKKLFLQTICLLKEKYYNWRYWDKIYKNIKKNVLYTPKKRQDQSKSYINKPGIAFSFDDSYRVNDWIKYGKKLLGYYDVRATFNINAFHHFEGKRELTQSEIDMLLELQTNGHEIAHHGLMHRKATDYANEFGINKWIEDEIESMIDWMGNQSHSKTKEKFKEPVSFAFPHFLFNSVLITKLVPKYFKVARGLHEKDNLVSFDHSGFAPSICLDGYYSYNIFYIKKILKLVKKSGKNLIITCHSILPKEFEWEDFGWGKESKKSGKWRTTPETIENIINKARKIGLEFYTTSELAGIATFVDSNFEKCVRELLSNPLIKWIPTSELISIKELDLSNREITNLDGIQYFQNLEKINLSNNKVTDFRLIEKLPKLKDLIISDINVLRF